jgi:integrase/recombinase XerD
LYQRMERDLKLKNLSAGTRREYLRCCCGFVRYHMKSPRELGEGAIKEYLEHLLLRGAGPETVKMNVAGLKFLYGVTLDRPKVAERLLWPKVPHKKADILAGSEVLKLLGAMKSLVAGMVLATAYGAGLRVSEGCRLRVEDIDGKRGLIHVRLGKGGKDRYVMLSPRLLMALRRYWVEVRPTGGWLFPGRKPGTHLTASAVEQAVRKAVKEAKLKKRITAHSMRHAFATHLLETGNDIRLIQALLGHASIRTTARYAQVSRKLVARAKSPLDLLGTKEGAVLG